MLEKKQGRNLVIQMSSWFLEFTTESVQEITKNQAGTKIDDRKRINSKFKRGFKRTRLIGTDSWLMELF